MLHPVLVQVGGVPVPTHDVFVGLGMLAAGAVFADEVRRRRRLGRPVDDRIWVVVAGALVGGALLARLGTWARHIDPSRNASLAEQWLYGNRSILSGLVGAYLGALLAKRLVGYAERTGDLFAPAVALGMTVGRFGCLFTERPGTPTGLPWGVTLGAGEAAAAGVPAGVPLHPSFAYEIAFHACAFAVLLRLRERETAQPRHQARPFWRPAPGPLSGTAVRPARRLAPGELLTVYLIAYGGFRFAVEFVRGNEVVLGGLTRPQLFLLACAPLAAVRLVRISRRARGAAPERVGDQMLAGGPGRVPERVGDRALERGPGRVPERLAGRVPERVGNPTPERGSGQAPERRPGRAAEGAGGQPPESGPERAGDRGRTR